MYIYIREGCVRQVDNFLSAAEAKHLLRVGLPLLAASAIQQDQGGGVSECFLPVRYLGTHCKCMRAVSYLKRKTLVVNARALPVQHVQYTYAYEQSHRRQTLVIGRVRRGWPTISAAYLGNGLLRPLARAGNGLCGAGCAAGA
jgi:hypothetical protein